MNDNVLNIKDGREKFNSAKDYGLHHGFNPQEGFRPSENGLTYDDPNTEAQPLWICSYINVTARTCNIEGENWGRVIEYKDSAGKLKKRVIAMRALGGRGDSFFTEMLDRGVLINNQPRAKNLLIQFIQNGGANNIVTCTEKLGWNLGGEIYILPEQSFSHNTSKEIVFQSEFPISLGYKQAGTLQDWRDNVAVYGEENSRSCFAISASFAAPLITPLGGEGGGFQFLGENGLGKSTTIFLAGSVTGNHERKSSWKGTANGHELNAYHHNDALLLLDEIGEAPPKEIGQMLYMFANGDSKTRMNHFTKKSWKLLFLSTGELTAESAMRSAGLEMQGGQKSRILDIEADTGKHGIHDVLINGHENGAKQSDAIKRLTAQYYGTAGPEFLRRLVEDKENALESVRIMSDAFLKYYLPNDASRFIERASKRFALVAAAGELATTWGITGWKENTAFFLVGECFKSWMYNLPSQTDSIEELQAIERVKEFIERYGESGFMDIDAYRDHQAKTVYKFGYRLADREKTEVMFCFSTSSFRNEVVKGLGLKTVFRALHKYGYLKTDKPYLDKGTGKMKTRNTLKIAPPELNSERNSSRNTVNVYAIYASILNHGYEQEGDSPAADQ